MAEKGRTLSQQVGERKTRTERLVEQRQSDLEQERLAIAGEQLRSAKQRLENTKSIQEYTQVYNSLSSSLKQKFKTPSEVQKENPSVVTSAKTKDQEEWDAVNRLWFKAKTGDTKAQRTLILESRYSKSFRNKVKELEKAEQSKTYAEGRYGTQQTVTIGEQGFSVAKPYQEQFIASTPTQTITPPKANPFVPMVSTKLGYLPESTVQKFRPVGTYSKPVEKESGLKPSLDYLKVISKQTFNTGSYYFQLGGSPSTPTVRVTPYNPQTFGSKKTSVSLQKEKERIIGSSESVVQELRQKKSTRLGIDEELLQKYGDISQRAYEQSEYSRRVQEGGLSFEDSVTLFRQSKRAKDIEKLYGLEYAQKMKETITKEDYSAGLVSFSTGFLSYLTPTSLTQSAGLKVLKQTFSYKPVQYVAYGTGTVVGTKIFSDKNLDPVTRVTGGIVAVVSGTALATRTYSDVRKFLSEPILKDKILRADTTTLEKQQIAKGNVVAEPKRSAKIGRTTVTDYDVRQKQLLSFEGRKTIVTTRFRKFLGLKPIYEGIPTRGIKITTYKSLGSEVTTYSNEGRELAIKSLQKWLGYTEVGAKARIRYYSPKVITNEYTGFTRAISGKSNVIYSIGKRTVAQPRVYIDDNFGVKTRFARTRIEDISSIGRKLGEFDGKSLYYSNSQIKSDGITKFIRQIVAVEQIQDSFITAPVKNYGLYSVQGDPIATSRTLSIISQKGIFPKTSARPSHEITQSINKKPVQYQFEELTKKQLETNIDIVKASRIMTFRKEYNKLLSQLGNTGTTDVKAHKFIKPAKIKKTPLSVTFGEPPKTSEGKLLAQQIKQLQGQTFSPNQQIPTNRLETALIPTQKVTQIPKVSLSQSVAVRDFESLSFALTGAVRERSRQKQLQLSKLDLREKTVQVSAFREMQDTGEKLNTALVPKLKNETRSSFKYPQPEPFIPPVYTPTIPKIEGPKPEKNPFGIAGFLKFDLLRQEVKKKKKKKVGIIRKAYLPSFTARALGLEPEVLNQKQARARLNKILTGAEIRRSIRLR